jgi:Eco57I restriction-modification methylase
MSFDKPTRNALANMVGECRRLLTEDIRHQLQAVYGLQPDGAALPVSSLGHLDERGHEVAQDLREWQEHLASTEVGTEAAKKKAAFDRLAHETAFTALNRLAALRMCEERGHVIECVGRSMESDGFVLYERFSGGALGTRGETYRVFLERMFDELAVDLGTLFDLRTPQSLVFPRERCLEAVLTLLNDPKLAHLWKEDETIGWVYQYFNTKEEREKMREESAAPRNSRELAVRNQFFTPRYVVEFLVDNTLGRMWYETRRGETVLRDLCRYLVRRPTEIFLQQGEEPQASAERSENLSQEDLLKQPVYIPHRPKKDPRDLKILDPACGSGHFLLYCFDLLEAIYEEAWADEQLVPSEATGKSLRHDFPGFDSLKRSLPELILRHNLHGIDIDLRCCQIAALALWLRAQRSYERLSLNGADRPKITRSNIVCAEPMPGEKAFLEQFIARLEPKVVGQLVKTVFDKMKLAGEAGSLLRIEEEIAGAVAEAKKQWLAGPKAEQGRLFSDDKRPEQQELGFDFSGITDETFWEKVEERIYGALRAYAEQADNGHGYQRRLFADDAARGFAFIDVCRKRYDAVLMNPPFGGPTGPTISYLSSKYPRYGGEVLTAFLDRGAAWLQEGFVGAITSRTPFYLPTFSDWRAATLFHDQCLSALVDLGANVLDSALVEAFLSILKKPGLAEAVPSFRLTRIPPNQRGEYLGKMCREVSQGTLTSGVYLPISSEFSAIPDVPLVYSAASELGRAYREGTRLSPDLASVEQGLSTKNDFRYLRLVTEVNPEDLDPSHWGFIAKGGEYAPYYDDVHLVVKAHGDFKELAAELVAKYPYLKGDPDWVLHPEAHYFVGGLTYPERTTSSFAPRVLPCGCYFSHVGLAIITGRAERDLELLGWLLSRPLQLQIELQVGSADAVESGSAARHYSKALIEGLRIVEPESMTPLSEPIREAVALARLKWQSDETSRLFLVPFENLGIRDHLVDCACALFDQDEERALRILDIQHGVDVIAEEAFSLRDSDLLAEEVRTQVWDLPDAPPQETLLRTGIEMELDHLVDFVTERCGARRSFSKKSYLADRRLELLSALCGVLPGRVSGARRELRLYPSRFAVDFAEAATLYSVGVAFGRWDIRFAAEQRPTPRLPDSFAPLPVCPPGMLQNERGLPLTEEDVRRLQAAGQWDYPIEIPWDGILVDDPGPEGTQPHRDDIVRRVRAVLNVIWKDRADSIEQEACELLGVKDLREYFRKPALFFADHLRRYSKSRRQAPIYWPLSTESGSYTIWIYYHRLNDQTIYTALNKYVKPKIDEVGRQLGRIEADLPKATGREASKLRESFEDTKAFLDELSEFRDELQRVAGLPYKPNLNDGVLITSSPLWKLFRLPKWRKDLEACWRKLETGDYEWAHLAYSIWPERVREVCRRDRSIAIAHGLEELCEAQHRPTKKKRPRKQLQEIEEPVLGDED